MESKRLIRLGLAEKLKNKGYRSAFFRARAQDEIATSIRYLREMRNLSQVELAKLAGMKQSAVSRIEQSEYSAWTYKTLQRVAEALDAQMYVVFAPAEQVIARYESMENFQTGGISASESSHRNIEVEEYKQVGSSSIQVAKDWQSTQQGDFVLGTAVNTGEIHANVG